jgi:hypothetical protein
MGKAGPFQVEIVKPTLDDPDSLTVFRDTRR